MGTDAIMFGKNRRQWFYFDRLYNLPERYIDDPMFTDGISVVEMQSYINWLIDFHTRNTVYGYKPSIIMLRRLLSWLKMLHHDDIVFIRNEHQDDYFDLRDCNGGEYKEHIQT